MTLSTPTTIALGSLLESSSISFAGAFVTAKTDTTHYTISNTSITGSGTATSNAINFNFSGQAVAPTGFFTTSGFTGGFGSAYNFSTSEPITASTTGTATIASSSTVTVGGTALGQIQLPMAPFVGDYLYVQVQAANTTTQTASPGQSPLVPAVPVGPILAAAAPIVTTPPAISGTPQVGQLLTVTPGVYSGRPTSVADQWQVAGSNVGPANSLTYIPVSGDATKAVRVVETAINVTGTTTTDSTPTSNVASAGPVATCTGGTHTSDGSGNTVIKFTSSGTLSCTEPFAAQDLVVGAGGGATTGGGGAGGYCTTLGTPTCGQGGGVEIPGEFANHKPLGLRVAAGNTSASFRRRSALRAFAIRPLSAPSSTANWRGRRRTNPCHWGRLQRRQRRRRGLACIRLNVVAGGTGSQGFKFGGTSAFGFKGGASPVAAGGGVKARKVGQTLEQQRHRGQSAGCRTEPVQSPALRRCVTLAVAVAGGYFTTTCGANCVSGGSGGGGNNKRDQLCVGNQAPLARAARGGGGEWAVNFGGRG